MKRSILRAGFLAAPGVVLAALGFTHPDDLDIHTAEWWTTLHLILIPLFPLLGVAAWFVLQGFHGWAAWVGRVAAFGYMVFYGALDVLAGVATGALVQDGTSPDSRSVGALFDIGNDLALPGTWLFLVACGVCTFLTYQRDGRATLPGGIVLFASAVLFLNAHIYWPRGVLSCLGFAIGFGWLGYTRTTRGTERSVASASVP